MGTIDIIEIRDLLESEGYNIDKYNDDEWEDFDIEFEDECKYYLSEKIAEGRPSIALNWAVKLGLRKK